MYYCFFGIKLATLLFVFLKNEIFGESPKKEDSKSHLLNMTKEQDWRKAGTAIATFFLNIIKSRTCVGAINARYKSFSFEFTFLENLGIPQRNFIRTYRIFF